MPDFFNCADCGKPSVPHLLDRENKEGRCYDCYLESHQMRFWSEDNTAIPTKVRGYDR